MTGADLYLTNSKGVFPCRRSVNSPAPKTGYSGHIRTLSLDAELALVPAEPSDAENAPDYRIHLGDEDGPEVGAG